MYPQHNCSPPIERTRSVIYMPAKFHHLDQILVQGIIEWVWCHIVSCSYRIVLDFLRISRGARKMVHGYQNNNNIVQGIIEAGMVLYRVIATPKKKNFGIKKELH